MKSKLRRWNPESRSPWLTRSEAADFLRWSERTIDRRLVPMSSEQTTGKIRFEVQMDGRLRKVRLLAEDVYKICPVPV